MTDRAPLHTIAVAAGVIVDLAATLIVGFAVMVVGMAVAGAKGQSMDGLTDVWMTETPALAAFIVIGLAGVVAGGYVAAAIARRDHVRHAVWVGLITLVIGAGFVLIPSDDPPTPFWYDAVSALLTVPAAVAGGALARSWT